MDGFPESHEDYPNPEKRVRPPANPAGMGRRRSSFRLPAPKTSPPRCREVGAKTVRIPFRLTGRTERTIRSVVGALAEVRRHLGPQASRDDCRKALAALLSAQGIAWKIESPAEEGAAEQGDAAPELFLSVGRGREAVLVILDFNPERPDPREARRSEIRALARISEQRLHAGLLIRYSSPELRREIRTLHSGMVAAAEGAGDRTP